MKDRLLSVLSALALLAGIGVTVSSVSIAQSGAPKPQTIHGLVRDIACPIQNYESTSRKFNRECALQCARRGSPLAILTDDGTMYLPISASMPDEDQRPKLMPFIAKYVSVTGEVYERNGLRVIVIREIKEDKSVAINGDAFQPE